MPDYTFSAVQEYIHCNVVREALQFLIVDARPRFCAASTRVTPPPHYSYDIRRGEVRHSELTIEHYSKTTMESDTFTATQYNTSDPTSFAHTSARERWPIIITQGIDDVHKSTSASSDDQTVKEGKQIISELAKLKYELQHDRELTPIPDDGEADVEAYNKELAARENPKWHNVPWLYAECYLYRYGLPV
jgi:hypothetical protein